MERSASSRFNSGFRWESADSANYETEKMRQSIFICPICRQQLVFNNHVYRCVNGHCFDISKEGYVNLLPANQQHSASPGDDKSMVNARTRFLSGGWYAPLRDELCKLAGKYLPQNGRLIDAGCGEGYYTDSLGRITVEKGGAAAGIDLSKAAVRRAAKRCPGLEIAVASIYHMPLAEKSVNLLVDCFAPLAADEFFRVLKPEGLFLYVIPDKNHLWEMKEILYERPYQNEHITEEYDGFRMIEEIPLEFRCKLETQEDIATLFHMTPYTWKTPKDGKDRLLEQQELDVTAQFRILAYGREQS